MINQRHYLERFFTLSRRLLYSKLTQNAGALYLIQIADYIFPLILVPYLVRVLGPLKYGTIVFAQGLIAYFTIFVEYGFNLSATRSISLQRKDVLAISRTACAVWLIKLAFIIVGFALLILLINIIPVLKGTALLTIILYGNVLGTMLFPLWIFQGMERMIFISIINLIARLALVIGVFVLVRQQQDYFIFAMLTTISSIGAGIIGMIMAIFIFRLNLVLPQWSYICKTLNDGWMIFLSTTSVSLYTAGNAFILGLFSSMEMVGYYSAAEKIIKAVRRLLIPVSQALYPIFNKMVFESPHLALLWGRRILISVGVIGFLMSTGLFICSSWLVIIILGSGFMPAITIIQILSPLPLLIALSNVLGVQILLPFGKDKAFAAIVTAAGVLNILLAIVLCHYWQAMGMAWAVLASELFVTGGMYLYLHIKGFFSPDFHIV